MLKCECLFPQVPFSQICSNLGSVSSISWIIRQVQKAFGGSWWRGAVGAEILIICRDMGSRRSRRPSVTEGLPLHQRDVCDGWSLIWQQVPESPWDINQPGAATADAAAAPISAHFTAVSSAAAAFFFTVAAAVTAITDAATVASSPPKVIWLCVKKKLGVKQSLNDSKQEGVGAS